MHMYHADFILLDLYFLCQGFRLCLIVWYLEFPLTGQVSMLFTYGLDTCPIPSCTANLTTRLALLVHLVWSPKLVLFLFIEHLVCVVLFEACCVNFSRSPEATWGLLFIGPQPSKSATLPRCCRSVFYSKNGATLPSSLSLGPAISSCLPSACCS